MWHWRRRGHQSANCNWEMLKQGQFRVPNQGCQIGEEWQQRQAFGVAKGEVSNGLCLINANSASYRFWCGGRFLSSQLAGGVRCWQLENKRSSIRTVILIFGRIELNGFKRVSNEFWTWGKKNLVKTQRAYDDDDDAAADVRTFECLELGGQCLLGPRKWLVIMKRVPYELFSPPFRAKKRND